jgi:hypothetical protein
MEQLILIAIFLLVGLINLLARRFRGRLQGPPPDTEAPTPTPEPESWQPRETVALPPSARVILPPAPQPAPRVPAPAPAATVAAAPPPRVRRGTAMRKLVGSPAEVRRAIIAMTILGPCRARESEPEVRTPTPSPAAT